MHYQWLAQDTTYPSRFREVQRIAVRTLEDEAVRRAHEGVTKLVFWKGRPVRVNGELIYETEYDSNLLMFLLKAYDRKRFGDKIETTFKDWSGNLEDLPDNVLAQIEQQLVARLTAE